MRILIVDDEIECADSLVIALKPAKFELQSETDPLKALELYKKTRFDVVITDVRMPNMNGIELLKAIRKFDEKARVIVITAYGELETSIAAINNRAVAFFGKPVNFGELVALLNDIQKDILNDNKLLEDIERLDSENKRLKALYSDLVMFLHKHTHYPLLKDGKN